MGDPSYDKSGFLSCNLWTVRLWKLAITVLRLMVSDTNSVSTAIGGVTSLDKHKLSQFLNRSNTNVQEVNT